MAIAINTKLTLITDITVFLNVKCKKFRIGVTEVMQHGSNFF